MKMLFLIISAVGVMSFLYILSSTTRMDPSPISNNHIKTDHHNKGTEQLKLVHQPLSLLSTLQWPVGSQPVKFNLMEETYGDNWAEASADRYLPHTECTIEYANANKLEQDHPCVIRLIRRLYLFQAAPRSVQYQLNQSETIDPSDGQSQPILEILHNKTNGFFVKIGGYGESFSNTLFMERYLNWSGLLIETDKTAFNQLRSSNRKAYISPACLSTKPYPMQRLYNGTASNLSFFLEKNYEQKEAVTNSNSDTASVYKAQCFPLYSLLATIDVTNIDYFALDGDGSEYKILKTIPWHKVYVKVMAIKWNSTPEAITEITRLMERNKFVKIGLIST